MLRGNAEVAEHQDEHEDVVDRERLLDQVAGQEFEPEAAPLLSAEGAGRVEEERIVEHQRQRDPDRGPEERFAEGDDVRLPVEHAEVEGEQEQDERREAGVEPPVVHEGKEQVHV